MAGCLNSMKENCRGIPRVPLGACLAMVCVFLTADFVAGPAAVIVATGKGRTTKKGEILDFTGKQLVIRTQNGQPNV